MGDEYWLVTQAALQGSEDPLFSKPKLTDTLLKKPPFRFIHDVVTGVQKSTGFAPGLFTDGEQDSKVVSADKEAKNVYLAKIIQCVSLVLGETVIAKPQKIMAGLEPELTNVFLQQLGRAARQCRETDKGASAVAQVMAGDAPPPSQPAPPPPSAPERKAPPPPEPRQAPPPETEAAPDMPRSSSRKGERGESRSSSRSREDKERSSSRSRDDKERSSSRSRDDKERSSSRSREDKEQSSSRSRDDKEQSSSRGREDKERERRERKEKERKERRREEESFPPPAADPLPGDRPPTGGQRPGSMSRVERPQSARRGPPKAGSRLQDSMPKESLVPPEGPKLFVEGEKDDDDDDVEVVTETEPVFGGTMSSNAGAEGQGALVKDILDAQKQLAQDAQPQEEEAPVNTGIVLKRRTSQSTTKGSAAAKASDLNALRTSIQTLCQSAMPLGKSMDYLQEDLENMKKELKFWMNEYRMYQARLAEQQRFTEDLLNPQATLADTDNQIRQAKERIKGMKSHIQRNNETISKLLGMVVTGNR